MNSRPHIKCQNYSCADLVHADLDSKWHNIRHKKGAEDAKRSTVFTKVAMQVRAAMDHGGNSPTNGLLSNVLKKAKELKVPKDIIDRAIKKAEQAKAGGMVIYEGMVCIRVRELSIWLVCMYDCMYVYILVNMYARMYACMYVCLYVCMYVCLHVCVQRAHTRE